MADTAKWWLTTNGAVEQGAQSLGMDRDGPFDSAEEAARAPEIARERARAWQQEDSEA